MNTYEMQNTPYINVPGQLEPNRPIYIVNYGEEVHNDQLVMKTTRKHNTQLRLAPKS